MERLADDGSCALACAVCGAFCFCSCLRLLLSFSSRVLVCVQLPLNCLQIFRRLSPHTRASCFWVHSAPLVHLQRVLAQVLFPFPALLDDALRLCSLPPALCPLPSSLFQLVAIHGENASFPVGSVGAHHFVFKEQWHMDFDIESKLAPFQASQLYPLSLAVRASFLFFVFC